MSLLHGLGRCELWDGASRVPGAVLGARDLPPGHGTLQLWTAVDGFRLFNRCAGDFIFSIMPMLSIWVVKESSYYYCASMSLKNKIGMNRGCCGMALNGFVSNWLSVDKARKAFPLWQECWLPDGITARTVVLQECKCLLAWIGVKHDSRLRCWTLIRLMEWGNPQLWERLGGYEKNNSLNVVTDE